jgi:hypothetical protein
MDECQKEPGDEHTALVPSWDFHRFMLPNMGSANERVTREVRTFRKEIEAALIDRNRGINIYEASVIGTACTAMREYLRIHRVIARLGPVGKKDGLTLEQFLACSEKIVKFKLTIDLCLQKLQLDKSPIKSAVDGFYETLLVPKQINGQQASHFPETRPNPSDTPDTH